MVGRFGLVAIAVVLLLPSLAAAQDAAVDAQLQMEAKRQRLIVRPDPPVAAAVRDAERASAEDPAARYSREADPTYRRSPQLDYDVTNAVQARNLPHSPLRTPTPGPNR